MKSYYVYIITNKPNGTFYVGVTNNIERRSFEHKNKLVNGFSAKHDLDILVYYETYENIEDAIHREKVIKRWKRSFKIDAIIKRNPNWRDLSLDFNLG